MIKSSQLQFSGVDPLRLGILVSGRGSNMEAVFQEIESGRLNAETRLVISDKQDAPALALAEKRGIPNLVLKRGSFETQAAFEKQIIKELKVRNVELVVLAGFMRLLGPDFLNEYPGRVINIHPSLLPAFPGLEAQRQALEYGVKITGCTVHFVNEAMDGGRIIAQIPVVVEPYDTLETLSARILKEEHRLLPKVIGLLVDVLRAKI